MIIFFVAPHSLVLCLHFCSHKERTLLKSFLGNCTVGMSIVLSYRSFLNNGGETSYYICPSLSNLLSVFLGGVE